MASGKVYLVGAGPGDPELLTVKADRCLRSADILVYDRLVHPDIVGLVPENCELIYAGKRKHLHAMSQERINATLVAKAREGYDVVRLKGGDPFIFGRGGEEAQALQTAGIEFEVVPGITAGVGAAATAGISLTHRDHAQAVTFVTAHRRHGQLEVDWDLVTRPAQAVVFYMAGSVGHELAKQLLARGCGGSRYITVVCNATRANETRTTRTLSEFVRESAVLPSPAVIILHDVEPLAAVGVLPPERLRLA